MSLAIADPAPADLYDTALRSAGRPEERWRWFARYEGGPRHSLAGALGQWVGRADDADRDLLARARGAVLDAGCGPGRLVAELAAQGREAVGVDTSRVAIALTRALGATAVRRSIFQPVPGEGGWDTVLLADGNIGIGGDPVALLTRCRDLLAAGRARPRRARPPGHRVARRPGAARARRGAGELVPVGARRGRRRRRAGGRRRARGDRDLGAGRALVRRPGRRRSGRWSAWTGRPDRARPGHRRCRVHRLARRRRRSSTPATRCGCSTRCCPPCTPPAPCPALPAASSWSTATSATPRRSTARCAGWTPSATRPRWSGLGRRRPGHARVRRHQRPGHRGAAGRRWPAPASAGWCWPARWSSTARAATTAPGTASSRPAARRRADLDAGRFEPAVPARAAGSSPGGTVPEDARWTRATPTPRPSSAQEHLAAAWAPRPAAARSPCATTTSTAPTCRATPPTPAWRRSSAARWRPGGRPRVFEDGGQRRDFVHVRDVARANLAALTAEPPDAALRAYNVASGRPHTVGDMARALADAFGGPDPDGHRRVPARRRAARRRQPGARRRRARLPGAGVVRRRHARLRDRPAAPGPLTRTSIQHRACGRSTSTVIASSADSASQNRCERGRQRAPSPAAARRRTAARSAPSRPSTRPDRSLTSIPARAASGSSASRPRSRPARRRPPARPPGRRRRGCRPGTRSTAPRGRRRRRRRAPAGRPPRSPRTTSSRPAVNSATTSDHPDGGHREHPHHPGPAQPRPLHQHDGRAPAAPRRSARRTGTGPARAAARRPAPAASARSRGARAAASASSATPHAVTPAKSASALVAIQTAPGSEDGEGRHGAGGGLVGDHADGDQHGRHGERAAGDAQRRRPARAAEPEPVEEHEGQQGARRVPGHVGRPRDRRSPRAPSRRRWTGTCPGRPTRPTSARYSCSVAIGCGERVPAAVHRQRDRPAGGPGGARGQQHPPAQPAGQRRPPQHDRGGQRHGQQHPRRTARRRRRPRSDVPAAQVQVAAVPGDLPAPQPDGQHADRDRRDGQPAHGTAPHGGRRRRVGVGGGAEVTRRRVGGRHRRRRRNEPVRRPVTNTGRWTTPRTAPTVDVVLPCLDEAGGAAVGAVPAARRATGRSSPTTARPTAPRQIAAEHGATVVARAAARLRRRRARRAGGRRRADVVCFCDADGSMDPAQLPRVADPVLAGRRRPGARPAPPAARGAWPVHARVANTALARDAAPAHRPAAARPRPDARGPPRGAARRSGSPTGASATRWRW